jgi:hypothetical protein
MRTTSAEATPVITSNVRTARSRGANTHTL